MGSGWIGWKEWVLGSYGDVAGLRAFRALFDSELNSLAFFQVPEAIALNSRKMYEDILSTFTCDKTVAFASARLVLSEGEKQKAHGLNHEPLLSFPT